MKSIQKAGKKKHGFITDYSLWCIMIKARRSRPLYKVCGAFLSRLFLKGCQIYRSSSNALRARKKKQFGVQEFLTLAETLVLDLRITKKKNLEKLGV